MLAHEGQVHLLVQHGEGDRRLRIFRAQHLKELPHAVPYVAVHIVIAHMYIYK